MTDTVYAVTAAWLLTYIIHSTLLLCGVLALARVAGTRFDPFAELAWRSAMFGAVITSVVQTLLLVRHPAVVIAGAVGAVPESHIPNALDPAAGTRAAAFVIPALLGCIAFVALLRLIAMVRAVRAMRRTVAQRTPVLDDAIIASVRVIAGTMRVRVSQCDAIATPLVIGARELCLPTRAIRELTRQEMDAVLAHEIAHVVRHDPLWLLLSTIMGRVLFFQPLNVLAVARLRAIAEWSCDDWAVRRTRDPVALASALARVSAWLVGTPSPAMAIAMATRESAALRRVRRVLDVRVRRRASRPTIPALGAATLLAASVLLVPGISASGRFAQLQTIRANDDAGPFTVTLDRGVVVGFTVNGASLSSLQVTQAGDRIRARDANGQSLDLTLTSSGGIRWLSRKPVALLP